jgi:NAD(P)-dependent dehydrogenase (short-subunit alcohol dehydrogenase family)
MVQHFQQKGWQVAATLRNPAAEKELHLLPNVRVYGLDVLDDASIRGAVGDALRDFGGIDVVINNAAYGVLGIFEAATDEQIQRQFSTNVFGVMRVIRAILPLFREQRRGMVVNISSIGGLLTFPLMSLYHGTKWALEGFTEALRYELMPLGIGVKLIQPGGVNTDFHGRSQELLSSEGLPEYTAYQEKVLAAYGLGSRMNASPEEVATDIYEAITDGTDQLRYVVPKGGLTAQFVEMRKTLPVEQFAAQLQQMFAGS